MGALTHSVFVCLQTCQTAALLGAAEETGAFGARQHETHHSEFAQKGQDAHQGKQRTEGMCSHDGRPNSQRRRACLENKRGKTGEDFRELDVSLSSTD